MLPLMCRRVLAFTALTDDNNCMCMDEYTKRGDPVWEAASNKGDVQFLLDNGFDAVKIDK